MGVLTDHGSRRSKVPRPSAAVTDKATMTTVVGALLLSSHDAFVRAAVDAMERCKNKNRTNEDTTSTLEKWIGKIKNNKLISIDSLGLSRISKSNLFLQVCSNQI